MIEEAVLSRARIRPARSKEDIERASGFLKTPRVTEIAEGHPEERGAVRICEVDDEIIGALLLDPTPLRIREVDVRCIRILETGGEDGRTLFRETGDRDLFVLLLEEALGYVWIKRYPLVYVHGELALYPQHGFVPCFFHPRVGVDVAVALHVAAPYRVRRLKSDDLPQLQSLRQQGENASPVVFAQGVPPFHHFCVEGPARRILGCFSLRVEPDSTWRPKLFVPEIAVQDRGAACTVLRHCAEQAREAGLHVMHFPVAAGHPLARLCLELGGAAALKGAAADPFLDEEMLHVADPPGLVRELAPHFARQLARANAQATEASVTFATGAGTWRLGVAEGNVRLDGVEHRPGDCIELPHWAFVQLLAGYRGAGELDAGMTAEQMDLLDLLLPRSWPLSLPDPDLWDPVRPPVPYARRAVRVVRETRLPWAITAPDPLAS